MFSARLITVFIVAGTYQKTTGQRRCQETQYYNEKVKDCCFRCPEGLVTRSTCVKDITKECATCPETNNVIIWSPNHRPTCATCRNCKTESHLVEVQKCSLLTEAICQCEPGYYCETNLHNTCARCNPFTQCPPGKGVKQKGTPERDTECEVCPRRTFSNVHSSTAACKPHTDCDKLHKVTAQKGNATANAVCGGAKEPSKNTTLGQGMAYTRYAATFPTTSPQTTTTDTMTSGTFTITTNGDSGEPGRWSMVYVVASIICVILLLIAFLLYWKQKICNLKLWKNFIQPELLGAEQRMVRTNMEGDNKTLLKKDAISPEIYQRIENTQSDWKMESKPEMQQGRDRMNNKIKNIYIMNADTVLVGPVLEVPTHMRSVMTECDVQEGPLLSSRYPEQESSKLSANDLMLSIEEEEGESCAAKAPLEV